MPQHQWLPNESQCPECKYFDISHPDVQRILKERDPSGQLLYNAQCQCRDRAMARGKMQHQQANLPHGNDPRTLQGFIARQGSETAMEAVRMFSGKGGRPVLLISGQTGTGKSHLLEAIGRELLAQGASVRYETASALLDRLRSTYEDNSEDNALSVYAWYGTRQVLLLDDLGAESATAWANEKLTALIDERIRTGRRLAIATNLGRAEIERHHGERLASRLFQTNEALGEVVRVTLTCSDYRQGP